MSPDIGVSRSDLHALESEMRTEIQILRESIDKLQSGKYMPFFGTAALFLVLAATVSSNVTSLEHEIDALHIEVAVARAAAIEFKRANSENFDRHVVEHRRERERVNGIVQFVKDQYGLTGSIHDLRK